MPSISSKMPKEQVQNTKNTIFFSWSFNTSRVNWKKTFQTVKNVQSQTLFKPTDALTVQLRRAFVSAQDVTETFLLFVQTLNKVFGQFVVFQRPWGRTCSRSARKPVWGYVIACLTPRLTNPARSDSFLSISLCLFRDNVCFSYTTIRPSSASFTAIVNYTLLDKRNKVSVL